MRFIAKAAMGALALASLGLTAVTPANAARIVVTTPNVVVTSPCMRAPEYRPAFCFRHDRDRLAFLGRDSMMRDHMWRDRERRQAFLEHRYERSYPSY